MVYHRNVQRKSEQRMDLMCNDNVNSASVVRTTEVRSREGGLRRMSAKLVTPVRGEPCVIIWPFFFLCSASKVCVNERHEVGEVVRQGREDEEKGVPFFVFLFGLFYYFLP